MLRVKDIMTADVVTVSPEISLREAMELFSSRHISGAPVVVGGKVVGVVAASDLLALASAMPGVPTERVGADEDDDVWERAEEWTDGEEPPAEYFRELWADVDAEVPERIAQTDGPEWNALEAHTVDEAMTRRVCAVRAEVDVRAAADFMRTAGVHRVIVMEGDQLVGIVSTMDLVKAIAEGRLTAQRYAFNADDRFRDRDQGTT